VKVVILPLLASFSWKRLQRGMGMLPITTSTSDEFFSLYQHRWFWKTLNFQNKGFYWFLRFSAAAHAPRVNYNTYWRWWTWRSWRYLTLRGRWMLLMCTAGCQYEVTTVLGNVSSPNWPDNYPSRKNCAWRFNVTHGHRVKLVSWPCKMYSSLFTLDQQQNHINRVT